MSHATSSSRVRIGEGNSANFPGSAAAADAPNSPRSSKPTGASSARQSTGLRELDDELPTLKAAVDGQRTELEQEPSRLEKTYMSPEERPVKRTPQPIRRRPAPAQPEPYRHRTTSTPDPHQCGHGIEL
jgi:hypothetical protein